MLPKRSVIILETTWMNMSETKIKIDDLSKNNMLKPPASLETSFIWKDFITKGKLKKKIIYKNGIKKIKLPIISINFLYFFEDSR